MTHGDHLRFQEQEDALAIYLLTYGTYGTVGIVYQYGTVGTSVYT